MSFLLTYNFSQDHLELFFSAVRSRGSYNNNPSAKQFQYSYKRLLVHAHIFITRKANCLMQDNTNILPVSTHHRDEGRMTLEEDTNCNINIDVILNYNISEYEVHVIAYIAGFITKKKKLGAFNASIS